MKKPITERETDFRSAVKAFADKFPEPMLQEFADYWTEPNTSGKKLRWELEKTWHLSRRLSRWANNGFGKHKQLVATVKEKTQPKPLTEIEALDKALKEYQTHPSCFTIEDLSQYYELMKRERLFKVFTVGEIDEIKNGYDSSEANWRKKCQGACVMRTFDYFTMNNFSFGELLKARANQ